MKKSIIAIIFTCGFLAGGIVGGLVAIELIGEEKYQHGFNQGRIDGAVHIIDFLHKHFAVYSSTNDNVVDFIGFKDRSIIVKKKDGILTLETE